MTPESAIRKAIVDALSARTTLKVYDQVLPRDEYVTGQYILMGSQSRRRMGVSKQHYEWEGSITITIVNVNKKGYISSVELDEVDGIVCEEMDKLTVPGFQVKFSRFLSSDSDVVEGPATTFNRRHITYELWINKLP